MPREQNAGGSHSMKIDNSSIERVKEFTYFWKNFNKSKLYARSL